VRQRLIFLAIAIACIALGLLVRAPALGLPREAAKYGGSILWAAMVYFGLRMIAPRQSIAVAAIVAALLATVGEATQLISIPWFDALRATPLGHLIFGRTFAVEDIVAYWIGVLIADLGEWLVRRRRA